jgi:hypothetical protein
VLGAVEGCLIQSYGESGTEPRRPAVDAPTKRVILPEAYEKLLPPCFNDSRIRGLQSICDETGLSPEGINAWLKKQGGQVFSCDHKDRQRFLCRLPAISKIPNIFSDEE